MERAKAQVVKFQREMENQLMKENHGRPWRLQPEGGPAGWDLVMETRSQPKSGSSKRGLHVETMEVETLPESEEMKQTQIAILQREIDRLKGSAER